MALPRELLSPYGFLTPATRMRELLTKIASLPSATTVGDV